MTAKLQNNLLLGAALALALGSALWFGLQNYRAVAARGAAARIVAVLSTAPYVPVGHDAPDVQTEVWAPPPAQHRGKEWIYDVFTPPEIFYDERTKQFSIAPPVAEPLVREATEAPPAPFGLELVGVKHALFRLQLVGYVGGEGTYRGLFENALTTETFLAGRGRAVPALNLTIEEFEVRRLPVTLPDSMTTSRLVATAVVRDDRTGEIVTLTNGERHYPAAPVATVTTANDAATPREVREGDQVQVDGAVFKIGKIQLAPPALDVTKVGADQLSEQRTLTVPPAGAAAITPPNA